MEHLRTDYDGFLNAWRAKEKAAAELLKITGDLRFDKSVELVLHRRNVYDSRPSEVLNDHLYTQNYLGKPITVELTLSIARSIARLDLAPARIDLASLASRWLDHADTHTAAQLDEFVYDQLKDFIGNGAVEGQALAPKDVVLYGFGRIGRIAARLLIGMTGRGEQLRLRAIVLRPGMSDRSAELRKRASLLRKDSVHGKFRGIVQVDEANEELLINGSRVKMIYASNPEEIDYTQYGINDALVIDNTGVWRDKDGLSRHLRPGISQVLFTAPGKGIPNIVYGVNQHTLNLDTDNIVCAASCTTNAIVPVLKVLNDSFGINNGHIETIHAYTSSQNLLDNFHKKPRLGRAAPLNMVITSTGAADAVKRCLPELEGKITGSAIRVPTPDGSLAILNLNLNTAVTAEQLNEAVRAASLRHFVEQIDYTVSNEFVSSDVIGKSATSVFDAPATKVSADGKSVVVYVWYDNEYGYTCQVLRLAKYVARVRRYHYY